MKIPCTLAMVLFTVSMTGQAVNEDIKLTLSQPSVLRIDAGMDINLSSSGSAILGESVSVSGGTPDFFYKWMDEDGSEFDDKNPEVNQTGRYWVMVTDQNHCSAIDSLSVLDYGTGLDDGPAGGKEYVVVDGQRRTIEIQLPGAEGQVSISVVSMDGKVVYTFSGQDRISQFNHRIDMSQAEKGIYLIHIRLNNRESVMKIFLQ